MAEWTNATVLKTVNPNGFVGSNPTPSARVLPPALRAIHARLPQSTYLVCPTVVIRNSWPYASFSAE